MFPLLQIGPIAIQVPGLMLVLSLWVALNLMEKEAKRLGQSADAIYGMTATALFGGVLGARLWYVVTYWDAYATDLFGIISTNTDTLNLTAGLIIGVAIGLFYGRWKNMPLRPTLDILAMGLAVMSIGLGLSHLASGNAFGSETTLPWAIELWGVDRHPTQLYEIAAAFGVFGILSAIRTDTPYSGFLFLAWVALTAVTTLFLQAFRGDSIIIADTLRQTQVIALLLLMAALWMMQYWSEDEAVSPASPSPEEVA